MKVLLAAVSLGALLAALVSASAGAKVLATTYGGKNSVYAFALAGVVDPHRLRFEVTSRRQERMIVHEQLKCTYRAGGPWHRTERRIVGKPPIRRRVRIPGDPIACIFGVNASRHDFAGSMAVTLYGRGRVFHRTGKRRSAPAGTR